MDGPGLPYDVAPVEEGEAFAEVRPYLLTGGRTRVAGDVRVTLDTVVVATAIGAPLPPSAASGQERCLIVERCALPASVAELSAVLRLPLAVTTVLVADLLAEGVLAAASTSVDQADDILLLERLIAGVAAL